MKSIITTLWLCFVVASQILAQNNIAVNSLTVGDPRNSWYTFLGTIDAASITARPKGIYTECEVYMTYSSKTTQYTKVTDTVEIVHRFTLPKNALIIDSWLWIEDVAERAKIIDRWTASQVYENIVKRRKDPSLLMKNSETDYEFRIFPMAGNEVRKVKLTILIPNNWEQSTAGIELPFNLFANSKVPLKNVKLQLFATNAWKKPQLIGANAVSTKTDSILGTYIESILPNNIKDYKVSAKYDTPMKDGVYVAQDSSKGNNYYQLAVQPEKFLGISPTKGKRLMIVVDFDNYFTSVKFPDFCTELNKMLLKLPPQDSFNIMYDNGSKLITVTNPGTPSWLSNSIVNITNAIAKLKKEALFYNAAFPESITESIDFIRKNGDDASILFALSGQLCEDQAEGDIRLEAFTDLGKLPPIHILDLSDKLKSYFYVNNQYFPGNKYVVSKLSLKSGGNYENYSSYYANQSLEQCFNRLKQNFGATNLLQDSDFYSTATNGYCHSRVNLTNSDYSYSIAPIIQVGKYVGKPPFNIQLVGSYDKKVYFKTIAIPESDIEKTDSTARQIWAGNYLINKELDYNNLKNSEIKDMIDLSIKNRVLCRFTAFLALDPKLEQPTAPTIPTGTGTGGGVLILAEETEIVAFDATAFPNPFNDAVTIQVAIEDSETTSVDIEIYSLSGQVIYKSNAPVKEGKATLVWASDSVAAGLYFAKINAGKQQKMLKLLKIQ